MESLITMSLYTNCVQDLLQRCSETHTIYAMRNNTMLKPMLALCERMKNPQTNYKCIHVSGTNGKGSVCTKLAASLSVCGYRVGLFTSPHISSIRERIRINGKMISRSDFVNDLNKILHYENDIACKLTYFEVLCGTALYHFKRTGVDFAIIEVAFDVGDVIMSISHALLSVIVCISLNELDKLDLYHRPTVIGPTMNIKHIGPMSSHLYQMKHDANDPFDTYDEHNTNLARYVLQILNKKYFILPKNLEDDELQKALGATPPCRMECMKINLYKLSEALLSSDTLTPSNRERLKLYYINMNMNMNINSIQCVLDVAHNIDAFKQLFKSLKTIYSPLQFTYRVVLAIDPDTHVHQNLKKCCEIITEYADYLHVVQHNNCIEIITALNDCYLHNNTKKELNTMPLVGSDYNEYKTEVVVITGGFSIMSDVRKTLGLRFDDDAYDVEQYRKHIL